MSNLKLKVFINDGDRRIENFNQQQWDEISIIFKKLIRNLKEEKPDITLLDFDNTEIPFVSYDVEFPESFTEEEVIYCISYLQGDETENPVYFNDEDDPVYAQSEIVFDDEDANISLLERFNKMAVDTGQAKI